MGRNALNPVRYVGPHRNIIAGGFVTKDGVVPTSIYGSGFTIAYVAEGRWTVTLDEAAVRIDAVLLSATPATNTGAVFVTEELDNRTTSVVEIDMWYAAATQTAHPVAADDPGAIVNFMIVCKDTSLSDF